MDADELREIVDRTSSSPKIVPGTESTGFKVPDGKNSEDAGGTSVENAPKQADEETA
jgi:hypothetical protein